MCLALCVLLVSACANTAGSGGAGSDGSGVDVMPLCPPLVYWTELDSLALASELTALNAASYPFITRALLDHARLRAACNRTR